MDEPEGCFALSEAVDCGLRLAVRAVSTLLHGLLQVGAAFDVLLLSVSCIFVFIGVSRVEDISH